MIFLNLSTVKIIKSIQIHLPITLALLIGKRKPKTNKAREMSKSSNYWAFICNFPVMGFSFLFFRFLTEKWSKINIGFDSNRLRGLGHYLKVKGWKGIVKTKQARGKRARCLGNISDVSLAWVWFRCCWFGSKFKITLVTRAIGMCEWQDARDV